MPGSCGWFPLPHHEIVAWVEQHSDELPHTLDELAVFPVAFRRVIVNRVSHERRAALWQAHLRTFLGTHSLTTDQRSFIEKAIEELPQIFSGSLAEVQARLGPLEERMRHVLTHEQAAAMFGMIGPPEPPEGLPLPPGTSLTPIERSAPASSNVR
jgi:hypothetical protein